MKTNRTCYAWHCATCGNALVNLNLRRGRGFCPGCQSIRRAVRRTIEFRKP